MKFSFKEWLLTENTISQLLKANYDPKLLKAAVDSVLKYFSTKAWANNIKKDKLMWYAKWIAYQYLKNEKGDSPVDFQISKLNSLMPNFIAGFPYSDYVAAMLSTPGTFNIIRSNFNNPNYGLKNLSHDSEEWHVRIASQKRTAGPEGRIVPLAGMPSEWQWVSLDKGYCDREGKAMGHCGNAGQRTGDNIYSLRDSKNIAHLTFIVNNGILGESKGYGNSKPTKYYHPMIIALLLGEDNGKEIVGHIRGGGYKPENNFDFKDLTEEQQKMVLQKKPYLLNYYDYFNNIAKNDPKTAKNILESKYNFKFENIDFQKGIVKVVSWDDFNEMIEWLRDNTHASELDDLDDFPNLSIDVNVSTKESIEIFKNYANRKNDNLMDEIIEGLKYQEGEENQDIEWAVSINYDLDNVLNDAARIAYEHGAEEEAWKYANNYFNNEKNEYGFTLKTQNDGKWEMIISLKDLLKLHEHDDYADTDDEIDLNGVMHFSYEPPHGGYEGFAKDYYNEMLTEGLENIKKDLEVVQ